jgi:shikimate dehydrogenase
MTIPSIKDGISGKSRVVGIVADPIGHVRTPRAFNALMTRRGVDAVMVPFHVQPHNFAAFMGAAPLICSLAGLVVTIPYKETILSHCTELTDTARRIGAVNIVRFADAANGAGSVVGNNLDGTGFVGGLLAQGHQVAGRRVYLAGAGGAAKAIAHALAEHGIAALSIHNRSAARAEQLAQDLRAHHPQLEVHLADAAPVDYTLAINSTSLGLGDGDPLPFSPDHLPVGAIVAEAVMKTDVTPLLARAAERGLAVHFGRHMMEVQIERMAQFLDLI